MARRYGNSSARARSMSSGSARGPASQRAAGAATGPATGRSPRLRDRLKRFGFVRVVGSRAARRGVALRWDRELCRRRSARRRSRSASVSGCAGRPRPRPSGTARATAAASPTASSRPRGRSSGPWPSASASRPLSATAAARLSSGLERRRPVARPTPPAPATSEIHDAANRRCTRARRARAALRRSCRAQVSWHGMRR